MDLARLACIRHAASVRPEPGSNSPSRSLDHPRVDLRSGEPARWMQHTLGTDPTGFASATGRARGPRRNCCDWYDSASRGAVARTGFVRLLFRFQGAPEARGTRQRPWVRAVALASRALRTEPSEATGQSTGGFPDRQPRTTTRWWFVLPRRRRRYLPSVKLSNPTGPASIPTGVSATWNPPCSRVRRASLLLLARPVRTRSSTTSSPPSASPAVISVVGTSAARTAQASGPT